MALKGFDTSGVEKLKIDHKTFSNLAINSKVQDVNVNNKNILTKSVTEIEEFDMDNDFEKKSIRPVTLEFSNILKNLTNKFPKIDSKKIVNYVDLYYISFDVIQGKYSLGEERKKMLEAEGYKYDQVQQMVNNILVKLNEGYSFDSESKIIDFLSDTINSDKTLINEKKATDKKMESTGENNFVKSFISKFSEIIKSIPFFHGGKESSATTAVELNEPISQISVKTQELEQLRKGLVEKGYSECEGQNSHGIYANGNWCAHFVNWVYANTYYGDKSAAEITGINHEEEWTTSTGRLMMHFLTASNPSEEELGVKYKDKQYYSPNDNIAFYYNDSCDYYTGMNSEKLPEGESIYVPKPGDYVFMENGGQKWTPVEIQDWGEASGVQDHTAMVKEVKTDENGNKKVVIVEGNYGSGASFGNSYNERELSLDDKKIIGYGTITNIP